MSLLGPACKPRVKFSTIYDQYLAEQTSSEQRLLSQSLSDQPVKEQSVIVPGIGTYATLFSSKTLSQIYRCPPPVAIDTVIGVISLGGGLYGTVNPTTGVLTNSDCQAYWSWQGISPQNQPRVIIKSVDGALNTPNDKDNGPTIENTLDVQTIGSWYPSSRLTIIMYLAQNTNLYGALNYAINSNVNVNGQMVKPSIISISWGVSETLAGLGYVGAINTLCSNAARRGVNICVATGDYLSTNGLPGNNVSCPASSAWVVACGGTSLSCPNNTYDENTTEVVWNSLGGGTGGGVSVYVQKPGYQNRVMTNKSYRCIPDISLNSDPNTGMVYYLNGKYVPGIGGTSTAAPAIAAFIATLNIDYFFNSKLYTLPSTCFHDITVGNNIGYNALTGYDLCTGFGSIIGTTIQNNIGSMAVTGVDLTPSSTTIQVGQTYSFTVIITPSNASNKLVRWVSSSPSVATINSSGLITGIAQGTTTITVTTDEGAFTTTATVTIPQSVIPVTGVTLTPASLTLGVGTVSPLTAAIVPQNATNKIILWSTTAGAIANVNSQGVVSAISPGSVTITATSQADPTKYAESDITVVTIPVVSITLNKSSITIPINRIFTLIVTINPANATNKGFLLVNNFPTIVRTTLVGNNWQLRGLRRGAAIIRVVSLANSAIKATLTVTVR